MLRPDAVGEAGVMERLLGDDAEVMEALPPLQPARRSVTPIDDADDAVGEAAVLSDRMMASAVT